MCVLIAGTISHYTSHTNQIFETALKLAFIITLGQFEKGALKTFDLFHNSSSLQIRQHLFRWPRPIVIHFPNAVISSRNYSTSLVFGGKQLFMKLPVVLWGTWWKWLPCYFSFGKHLTSLWLGVGKKQTNETALTVPHWRTEKPLNISLQTFPESKKSCRWFFFLSASCFCSLPQVSVSLWSLWFTFSQNQMIRCDFSALVDSPTSTLPPFNTLQSFHYSYMAECVEKMSAHTS